MKKQENYKDIYKALKDDTDFPLPETLAPDAIVKTVASVRVQPKKRHTARYASLAAALVLVTLAGVVGIRLTNAPQNGGGYPYRKRRKTYRQWQKPKTNICARRVMRKSNLSF